MLELAPIALGIICATAFSIVLCRIVVRMLQANRDLRLKEHLSWAGDSRGRASRIAGSNWKS